jgi:predicted nucleic acid-binding protein
LIVLADTSVWIRALSNRELALLRRQPHKAVVEMVLSGALNGRGIGWIDAHLLAAAYSYRIPLWTADAKLAAVADELGIGYRPSN